ncbi:PspA/IM30 family protein [Streptomyces sp. NPDC054871]
MSQAMNFILTGRDQLSRVFDRAGDSAERLHRRISAATTNSGAAVNRFTSTTTSRLASMQRDSDAGSKALEQLKKTTLSLAPAAIPAAASLVPIAAGAGAVAVAALAMGAALAPQIAQLSEASEAQKKYEDAVAKSGARSEAAVTAQREYAESVAKLPPETRRAAAAVGILKDEYREWSDSLAGDTMQPFTKGVALVNALLPKTKGLVQGTSAEADRFITTIGGAMATPGLDSVNRRFTDFTTGTLRKVNDELVHVMRTSGSGEVGGNVKEFMTWARAQGPTVASVMQNVGTALVHVLQAGSDIGVGMLQAIDVLARLVAAVPPGALALFLQLALAMRLVRLAATGMAAGRAALVGFTSQLLIMQAAAAGAPGRLSAVTAAIGAMSRGGKIALAGTGIGLLVIALAKLQGVGKAAPPDVDKLTTSLGNLARTGKVSGEAARAYGSDLGGLADSLRTLARPSNAEGVQQWLTQLIGMDSTPVKNAKEDLDGADKALANLVKGGHSDLAAAAFDRVAAAMRKEGMSAGELRGELGDYKSALADQRFEQELAAESMGLFGQQAQDVQAKLNAQKLSTDGLRQSIIALNEVNRAALDGRAGMEAAIDNAAKLTKKHANSLRMVRGELDLGSPKAREASAALTELARKTEGSVTAARESGRSWTYAKGQYDRGRAALIRSADAMGLTRGQAVRLADQILKTPNKTAYLKGNLQDLQGKLAAAKQKLRTVPDSRKAQVRAEIAQLQRQIRAAKGAIASVRGKSVTITTHYRITGHKSIPSGTYLGSTAGRSWRGGHIRKMAAGGDVTAFPHGGPVFGPGTGTSDSIPTWLSNNEFVIKAQSVAKYGLAFMHAVNNGTLNVRGLAGGGALGGAGVESARGLAEGIGSGVGMVEKASRAMAAAVITGMKDELQIASPSKRTRALAKDVGKGLISGLTGSRDKIKATSKDLAKDIWSAFTGSKDNRLVSYVNRHTKTLLSLASKRDSLAAAMKLAKDFAESTRVGAKKSASLSGMFEGDEQVSASGINSKLQQRLARMRTFSSYIKTLAKRGLNKTMLREILEMGPEEGYAYASALAGSNSKILKEINTTQFKINDQAESLGRSGADALYDSGKNAGRGFLKGLASQQDAIEKQMLKIAKGMQKALRKALGIRSPATAMIPDGENTARGVGVGVLRGLPFIENAMNTVAGRMTGRIGATKPVAGRPAFTGAGGSGNLIVNVAIGNAMDPVAVAREFEKVLIKHGRTQGLKVQLVS